MINTILILLSFYFITNFIFSSLQFNPNIKEIHNNLLAKLINGYVGHNENSDTYVSWKLQFRNYCDLPTQQNGSVLNNVYYLEKVGLLGVGKYDVLKKIFSEDKEALSEIENVSNVIEIVDPSTIGSTGIYNDSIYSWSDLQHSLFYS